MVLGSCGYGWRQLASGGPGQAEAGWSVGLEDRGASEDRRGPQLATDPRGRGKRELSRGACLFTLEKTRWQVAERGGTKEDQESREGTQTLQGEGGAPSPPATWPRALSSSRFAPEDRPAQGGTGRAPGPHLLRCSSSACFSRSSLRAEARLSSSRPAPGTAGCDAARLGRAPLNKRVFLLQRHRALAACPPPPRDEHSPGVHVSESRLLTGSGACGPGACRPAACSPPARDAPRAAGTGPHLPPRSPRRSPHGW